MKSNDQPGISGEEPQFSVRTCETCPNTVVVIEPVQTSPECHDEPMKTATDSRSSITRRTLSSHLADAFDIPESGTAICHTLLFDGLYSTTEIASQTGYDGTTVRTHLDRLVTTGLLERTRLDREGGGSVDLYRCSRQDRPTTLTEFCLWAIWAAGRSVADVAFDVSGAKPAAMFQKQWSRRKTVQNRWGSR